MRILTITLLLILGGLIVYKAEAKPSQEISYDFKKQIELERRARPRARARLARLRRR